MFVIITSQCLILMFPTHNKNGTYLILVLYLPVCTLFAVWVVADITNAIM